MNILLNSEAIIVFFGWLAAFSLILFFYALYKLRISNQNLASQSATEKKRWADLELKAQHDYHEIIAVANKRASEIILQASKTHQDTAATFDESLSSLVENQKEVLRNKVDEISKKSENEINELDNNIILLLTNIYKDIELTTQQDLEKYKEALRQQTFEAQQMAEKRMQEEYQKLEKEIEERKQERLASLENNIYKILTNVSKDIIGRSLDFSSQQDLILKALSDAKKEGVL
jgi:F0F1-type ATP synthase membrane subunit b/b'